MTNQEVLDMLRATGLDVKSVSSTVEDADIARAFAPTINPGRKARAAAAKPAGGTQQAPAAQPVVAVPVIEETPAETPAVAESPKETAEAEVSPQR